MLTTDNHVVFWQPGHPQNFPTFLDEVPQGCDCETDVDRQDLAVLGDGCRK